MIKISYMQFLEEAVVPSSFELHKIIHRRDVSGNPITEGHYRYQLAGDSNWAHGKIKIHGNYDHIFDHLGFEDDRENEPFYEPSVSSELMMQNSGFTSDKKGLNQTDRCGDPYSMTNHGAHNYIAAATREVIKAHFNEYPFIKTISGESVDTLNNGTDRKDNQKFEWRLRSLSPLAKEGYKLDFNPRYRTYSVTRPDINEGKYVDPLPPIRTKPPNTKPASKRKTVWKTSGGFVDRGFGQLSDCELDDVKKSINVDESVNTHRVHDESGRSVKEFSSFEDADQYRKDRYGDGGSVSTINRSSNDNDRLYLASVKRDNLK